MQKKKQGRKGAENRSLQIREFLPGELVQYRHYDMDIEASVLGICILEPDGMAKVRNILKDVMFFHEFHRIVYQQLVEMWDAGLAIDQLTINSRLHRLPGNHPVWAYDTADKPIYLRIMKLSDWVVRSTHVVEWAFIIRELYVERAMFSITTGGMTASNAREQIKLLEEQLQAFNEFEAEDDWQTIDAVLVKLYQYMASVEGKDVPGVPSGMARLDKTIGGFLSGLYYLGARPSMGKTALALKWIMNQVSQDIPVGIISLETSGYRLAARVLSMLSGIEYWRIIRSRMDDETKGKLYTYTQVLSGTPLYLSDRASVTLRDIRSKVYKLMKAGAKVIYIDFLQLVEPDEGAGTREQEVARISRGLKLLSLQTGLVIIVLCQLSREAERQQGNKGLQPKLIHLRESGSIEQDADGVMLLHRPEKVGITEDEDGNSTKGKAELIIAKWKDGELFTHDLFFNGDRMEFSEDDPTIQQWKMPDGSAVQPVVRMQIMSPRTNNNDEEDPF